MDMLLKYDQAHAVIDLNWQDIWYGIDAGLMHPDYPIHFAVALAKRGRELSSPELEIACLQLGEPVSDHLKAIISKGQESRPDTSKMKVMNLLLLSLISEADDIEAATRVVEDIYVEFGYPQSLARFVRYMPVDHEKGRVNFNSLSEYTDVLKRSIPIGLPGAG